MLLIRRFVQAALLHRSPPPSLKLELEFDDSNWGSDFGRDKSGGPNIRSSIILYTHPRANSGRELRPGDEGWTGSRHPTRPVAPCSSRLLDLVIAEAQSHGWGAENHGRPDSRPRCIIGPPNSSAKVPAAYLVVRAPASGGCPATCRHAEERA